MTEEEALKNETEKVIAALNESNVDWLSKHYVPEVTRFHQRGRLDLGWSDEKAERFRRMIAAGLSFEISSVEIADVRVYCDTAIAAGHFRSRTVAPGTDDLDGMVRFTYVWTKVDGAWKEVHHHVSDLRDWGA